jgi:hypothetical protein
MTHEELLSRRGEAESDSGLGALPSMTRSGTMLWDLVNGQWLSCWSDDNYTVLDGDGLLWSTMRNRILLIPSDDPGLPALYEAIIAQQVEKM